MPSGRVQRTPIKISIVSWSRRSYRQPRLPSATRSKVCAFRPSAFDAEYFPVYAASRAVVGIDLGQKRLDLLVGIPAGGLVLEDQVGAHAAAGEILHTLVILGAVGVRVEVPAACVFDIFQELDQEEGGLRIARPEAQVLVVAARDTGR